MRYAQDYHVLPVLAATTVTAAATNTEWVNMSGNHWVDFHVVIGTDANIGNCFLCADHMFKCGNQFLGQSAMGDKYDTDHDVFWLLIMPCIKFILSQHLLPALVHDAKAEPARLLRPTTWPAARR